MLPGDGNEIQSCRKMIGHECSSRTSYPKANGRKPRTYFHYPCSCLPMATTTEAIDALLPQGLTPDQAPPLSQAQSFARGLRESTAAAL
jgi:hypothetical protein